MIAYELKDTIRDRILFQVRGYSGSAEGFKNHTYKHGISIHTCFKQLETGFYKRSFYDLSPALHGLYEVTQTIRSESIVYTVKIFTGIFLQCIAITGNNVYNTEKTGAMFSSFSAKGYSLNKILSLKSITGGFIKHGGRPDHNNHAAKSGQTASFIRIISGTRAMAKGNARLKRSGDVLTLNPAN